MTISSEKAGDIANPRPVPSSRGVADSGSSASPGASLMGAASDQLRRESLSDLLEAWNRELGPPSEQDDAWVRQVLGI